MFLLNCISCLTIVISVYFKNYVLLLCFQWVKKQNFQKGTQVPVEHAEDSDTAKVGATVIILQ